MNPPAQQIAIEVKDLTMAYGERVVMKDLNFTIQRGDIFIIMGGSGCGKSTLMRHLLGLEDPAKGEIFYGDRNFTAADRGERNEVLKRLGVMYQSGALFSSMTLAENIALPLSLYTKLSPEQIRSNAIYKLALVGLAGFEDFYPSEISGGMNKRAAIARALALDPEIVFLDEPSAGLDPLSAARLDQLLLELRKQLNCTFVVVTHELASIFTIANNGIFLDVARKVQGAVGNPRELRDHSPDAGIRAFLNRGEVTTQNSTPPKQAS
jgi:phospholipid/cholesterol/gamma-HCH transport system ATP-binding protein